MSFEVFLKTSYYLSSYSSQKKSEGLYGQGAGRLVAWLPVSHFPKICAVGLSAVDCRAVDMYEDVSTYRAVICWKPGTYVGLRVIRSSACSQSLTLLLL
jgi:hypothetical protein